MAFLKKVKITDENGNFPIGTHIKFLNKNKPDRVLTEPTASTDESIQGRYEVTLPKTLNLPRVRYFPKGEKEMIAALKAEKPEIDAIARGEIGNYIASKESDNRLKTVARFGKEQMAFAVDKDNPLRDKLNKYIDFLTDNGKISFKEFLNDPQVYLKRAPGWLGSCDTSSTDPSTDEAYVN